MKRASSAGVMGVTGPVQTYRQIYRQTYCGRRATPTADDPRAWRYHAARTSGH
jgi:hypothetical protein